MTPRRKQTRRVSEVIAQRVEQVRKARGLSQRDVAQALGALGISLHQTAIAKIENGERKVTVEEALLLAAVLNVAPANLFLPLADNIDMALGTMTLSSGEMRQWIRGRAPLPGYDSRPYFTEIPDSEWAAVEDEARRRAAVGEAWREMADATGGMVLYDDSQERGLSRGPHREARPGTLAGQVPRAGQP